jgi:undecaprenyl-diphosphatase
MTHFVAIILGFVEGATEFIPVSSSGHLIIFREILGIKDFGGLAFDAILQLSASLALIVYFWKDVVYLVKNFWILIKNRKADKIEDPTLLYAIVIGSIPAVVFGLFFENLMESLFRNTELVALTLVLGSILFWYAEKNAKKNHSLTLGRGLVIGIFQCLALVPGVSRSGATISGGLITGLSKDEAVRFSFLLSIPILFGAGLKKLFEIRNDLFTTDIGSPLLFGSITAFITGLVAINFLIKYLRNHDLNVFIWYRIVLAIIIVFIF